MGGRHILPVRKRTVHCKEKAVGECDPNHLSELVLAELRSASSKSA